MSKPSDTIPVEQSGQPQQTANRRDIIEKLGKCALYAAPFTLLAMTNKAEAASGGGPHPTPFAARR